MLEALCPLSSVGAKLRKLALRESFPSQKRHWSDCAYLLSDPHLQMEQPKSQYERSGLFEQYWLVLHLVGLAHTRRSIPPGIRSHVLGHAANH